MGRIMPEMYKGEIKRCNELINAANLLLFKPDKEGNINAIVILDDIDDMLQQIAIKIGELEVLLKGLNASSVAKDKYIEVRTRLRSVYTELQESKSIDV